MLGLGILIKLWKFLNRTEYKIDTMWIQFLIEHPEYERRETMRNLHEPN